MTVVTPNTKGLMDSVHAHILLNSLNEQRTSGMFCDVTIVVEDIKFRAHRNILAASSGYFRNAFSALELEPSGQVLELLDLRSEVFASILNFIYSSKVTPASTEDVKMLVAAGKKLGIPFLEKLVEQDRRISSVPFNQTSSDRQPTKAVSPHTGHYSPSLGPGPLKNETLRTEEPEATNGPRITNAFSITEVGPGSHPFTPLGLRNEGRRLPEPELLLPPSSIPTQSEPAHNLSEHSYAVSQMHGTAKQSEERQGGPKEDIDHLQAPPRPQMCRNSGPLKKRHRLSMCENTPAKVNIACQPPATTIATPSASTLERTSSNTSDQVSSSTEPPVQESASAQTINPPYPPVLTSLCEYCPETSGSRATAGRPTQIHRKRFVSHLVCKFCCRKFMHLKRLRNHEQACSKARALEPERNLGHTEVGDGQSADSELNAAGKEACQQPALCPENPSAPKDVAETAEEVEGPASQTDEQRVYTCSMCKRAYVTLSSLRRHENVHSWRRAYPCHYCDKVFALAEYRTKHEVWHTGERRYQCIFCLETFMTYYILKNHQKSYHGIDPRLAVNKKSANGAFKGSAYPIKLYRLLPMKFRKRRYTYSQTFPEECHDPALPPTTRCNSTSVSLEENNAESVSSRASLFSMPVTFMATPKVVASMTPRVSFVPPCDQSSVQSLSSEGASSQKTGPSCDTDVSNDLSCVESSGPTVISFGYTAPRAPESTNNVSSVMQHSNDTALAQVKTYHSSRPPLPLLDQRHSSSFELPVQRKLQDLPDPSHPAETMAEQLPLPGRDHRKTETYIAKPACPGPSIDSEVLPLCQITVKIGEEAIVCRKIRGSKLFPRKRKKSHYRVDDSRYNKAVERNRSCPTLRLRTEVNSLEESEPYDDAPDHDTADQLWRPYYSYKPKKKPKKLRCKQGRSSRRLLERPLKEDMLVPEAKAKEDRVDRHHAERRNQMKVDVHKKMYTCDICTISFFTLSSLRTHVIGCRACPCRMCGKPCSSEGGARGPEGGGDFVCRACTEAGSCFENAAHGTLSTEKRYRCSFCPQRFLYLATKRSHEKKHLEKHGKVYGCYYCPKVCKSATALAIHQKRHFIKAEEGDGDSKPPARLPDANEAPKAEAWEFDVNSSLALKLEEQVEINSNGCYQELKHHKGNGWRLQCNSSEGAVKRASAVNPEYPRGYGDTRENDRKDRRDCGSRAGASYTPAAEAGLPRPCKEELCFHTSPVTQQGELSTTQHSL